MVIPATGVEANLLKRSELEAIVGDTDMTEVESYTGPDTTTQGFEPRECLNRAGVATALGYVGEEDQAIVGNTNQGANGRIAAQVISVWENHHEPRNLLASTARGWALCRDGQPFTVVAPYGERGQYWVAGQISTMGESRVSTVIERQEPPGWTCHHLVAIQANIAVETAACGEGDTAAQASEIADRILARFPR
ncbi:hypothetical protein AU186_23450 [Mycobacterium sp. GA-1999]|nr:hypothetical protein AU186_23450 [Mycobacterium sp. GA-1999]